MRKIYKTEKEAKVKKTQVLIPLYKKFKKKKVINYCEECGHKTGSHIEKIPVGKPYGYWKRKKTHSDYFEELLLGFYTRNFFERVKSNSLYMNKFRNKDQMVKFRRYGKLKI